MQPPFNAFEVRIWRQLVRAFMVEERMVISVDEVVDNLQQLFGLVAGDTPGEVATSLLAMPIVLGPFFFAADAATLKKRVEKRMRRTDWDVLQDTARLRGMVYAGYYGHFPRPENGDVEDPAVSLPPNPVLDAMRFTLPRDRDRSGADDLPVERRHDRDLPNSAFVGEEAIPDDAEVIVVGSGAGGAVAAANLVAAGYRVLVIEAGAHRPSVSIDTHELRQAASLYKDGAIQTTADRDIIVFQGRVVGGGTIINNGICLRVWKPGETHPAAERVLETWEELGAPVRGADLDAAYARVEARLGIAEIGQRLGRNNGTHLQRAWAAHLAGSTNAMDRDAISRWFRKNWRQPADDHGCVSSGYCNTGCPYGRKTAAPEGYLGDAVRGGARILPEAEAIEILWDDDRDGSGRRVATGVEIELAGGARRRVRASKGVVVAAGTIASSNILRASGIALAGRAGISLNMASPVVALMPSEQRAWDEDQMATYVDRGDFLLESHFQPPMSMATLVPGWFGDHMDRMVAYNRLASAGVLVPCDRNGRIEKGKLRFKLHEHEMRLLRRAIALLARVHFAGGAQEVYPALLTGEALSANVGDIDGWLAERAVEPDDLVLSSSHPHGGNAISTDPDMGVVDLDQRVHGTANLLVTDASVMPSCIRVNAQLTTMAMADRVTHGRRPF